MQDVVEKILELMQKLLGELQSPFFKKYSPSCEKNWSILFENAAQEMGKFVGGHKKFKTFAQEWEQNSSETMAVGKKKSKRRTGKARSISRKSRSKNSCSRNYSFDKLKRV